MFVSLQVFHHDIRLVVDRKDDLRDASLGQGFDLVTDDGLVAEVNARLGKSQGHWPETGTESTDENQSFHFYQE